MKLSRKIPARTETILFNWCKKDFLKMSQGYRNIRAKMSSKMDTCFWCKHRFKDGEMMALAQPKAGRNKVLCQKCAGKLLGEEVLE